MSDDSAATFGKQPPSVMLEHQSKYAQYQLDIQDKSNCSMLSPIHHRNNRHHEYQTHLMNQLITDSARHAQLADNGTGDQADVSDFFLNAENDQRRRDQLFGQGDNCPLCERTTGSSKRYSSEHAFQFHLRRRHRPRCPNCQIRLVKWSDYNKHLAYCARKYRNRLKPGLDRRIAQRAGRPVLWDTHTWHANGRIHHTVTER